MNSGSIYWKIWWIRRLTCSDTWFSQYLTSMRTRQCASLICLPWWNSIKITPVRQLSLSTLHKISWNRRKKLTKTMRYLSIRTLMIFAKLSLRFRLNQRQKGRKTMISYRKLKGSNRVSKRLVRKTRKMQIRLSKLGHLAVSRQGQTLTAHRKIRTNSASIMILMIQRVTWLENQNCPEIIEAGVTQ